MAGKLLPVGSGGKWSILIGLRFGDLSRMNTRKYIHDGHGL